MISFLLTVLICFLAGAGAGLGTGFAGMSAATVISPILFTFLGIDSYEAIGIALASDVLASAVSAYTYKRNKNLNIKNAIVMMATIMLMTVVGSIVGNYIPHNTLGNMSVIMTFFLGLKFIIKPVNRTREMMNNEPQWKRILKSVLCGIYVGFVCGFIGAGGGLMMLFMLTVFLGYELKIAVGTSVFIMTFTALLGAVTHFINGGLTHYTELVLCSAFTLLWARIASVIANKVDNKTLNRLTGVILVVLGVAILLFRIFAPGAVIG